MPPIDVNELVQEIGDLLGVSISKKIQLRYRLADTPPIAEVDAAQIQQVIMNLILNAAEAIGEAGGVVSVTTRLRICDPARLDHVFLGDEQPQGLYAGIEISDSGCGMDEQTLGRIFDPFFSTKFAGRGLGLAALLGIVRGHDGVVQVASAPGVGTTFTISLPASEQPAAPLDVAPPAVEGWRGAGKILLADDEAGVRRVVSMMLEDAGFEVLLAADGAEALELHRAHADDIACVILDLAMPRMSGEQAVRELRKIDREIPILLSSGYPEKEVLDRFGPGEVTGVLNKPFLSEALIAKVRETLG
jgi:CheY-like chemotaxis protein